VGERGIASVSENVNNWTTNQKRFQEWLATPKFIRTPPTQDMLSTTMGLNAATLSRWRKLDGFQSAVTEIARQFLSNDLPDIYGALRREAIKGSFNHIKLALELSGEHVDKVDVTSGGEPIKGYAIFSPDDWDDEEGEPEL